MKLKHYDHDGRARFITFCTHNRMRLLTNDSFRSIVVEVINEVRAQTGLKLLGYVIMPDHIHLVLVPPIDGKVGFIIGEIKRISARKIHRRLKVADSNLLTKLSVTRRGLNKFAFWQKRCFDHNCRTEEAVWTKVKYCHDNPVKWGLVKTPGEWRWSSYNCYHGEGDFVLEVDFEGCPI
jgi:putative transposase